MGTGNIRRFQDLEAWKECYALALEIYGATNSFHGTEQFGIVNQMRRTAVSCTSNIAEGFSRTFAKDKARFYSIALASLTELQSQIELAAGLQYIDQSERAQLMKHTEHAYALIRGLVRSAQNFRSP